MDGDINAGISMGNIKINSTKEKLLNVIGTAYKEEHLEFGSILEIENVRFWIATDGKVDQIGIGKGFKGNYKNKIGIGSTLADVRKYVGDFIEIHDTYKMKEDKGICFELEDVEDWEELTAPIEFIYVFRV